jgi:hypothetical protein
MCITTFHTHTKLWGSHGTCEDYRHLGCGTVQSERKLQTFLRNLMPVFTVKDGETRFFRNTCKTYQTLHRHIRKTGILISTSLFFYISLITFLIAGEKPSFRCAHSRVDSSVGIVTRLRTGLPGMRAVVLGRNKLSLLHSVDLLFGPTQPSL